MSTEQTQNESALVCLARDGDKDALHTLLQRNWAWLKALVYGIVGSSRDLDDILQDICVRVISGIRSLHEPERFRPWLAIVARNEALQYGRRASHRRRAADERMLLERDREYEKSAHEAVEQKEAVRQLQQALDSLPDKYREVLVLQYCGDLTYARIAEILDIPVTTVQIRLVRARRMILDRLKTGEKVQNDGYDAGNA